MYDQIKKQFPKNMIPNQVQRVINHPLDLYLGYSLHLNYSLILKTSKEPPQIYPSEMIDTFITYRKIDKNWIISFCLKDNVYLDLFMKFCNDIIESSKNLEEKEKGADFVCYRYLQWQKMLKKNSSGLLTQSEIIGLLGELIVLERVLIPQFGEKSALSSWIGPERADQDFVYENTWYEVKTISIDTNDITISSIEQLDTKCEGELILVYLDKTSSMDSNRININNLVKEIKQSLINKSSLILLDKRLSQLGYVIREEYDDLFYKLHKVEHYKVDKNFPAIRRKLLNKAILKANYTISISSISKFKKGE